MNSFDLIRMSFSSLWRRKMRTILTVLGVIIGSSSIVVMMSLGIGIEKSVKDSISTMGSINTITVNPGYNDEGWMKGSGGRVTVSSSRSKKADQSVKITDDIIVQISSMEHVTGVMETIRADLKFVSGKLVADYIDVVGVNPAVMEEFDIKVDKGRLLTVDDTNAVVFGGEIPYRFRNPKKRNDHRYYDWEDERPAPPVDVLNDSLMMTFDMSYGEDYDRENKPAYRRYKVEGVGVMDAENYNEHSYTVFMPIDYLLKIKNENQKIMDRMDEENKRRKPTETSYDQLKVRVDNIKNVEKIQEQIRGLGLSAYSMTEMLTEMQKTTNTIQAVLGGIGAVSLIVAAIGIANTMVMSIYERTREIGIMKVLGCLIKNIRSMFLIESAIIGLLGGILSIGLSFLASYLINKFGGTSIFSGRRMGGEDVAISIIPIWLMSFSVFFSTAIGILSGLYPAIRATKISALKAMSNE